MAVVADFLLTAVLIYEVRTDSMIDVMIMYSVNTGLLTGLGNLLSLFFAFLHPENMIWIGLAIPVTKAYANTLMAALNSRRSLISKGSGVLTDTSPFGVSVVQYKHSHQSPAIVVERRVHVFEATTDTHSSVVDITKEGPLAGGDVVEMVEPRACWALTSRQGDRQRIGIRYSLVSNTCRWASKAVPSVDLASGFRARGAASVMRFCPNWGQDGYNASGSPFFGTMTISRWYCMTGCVRISLYIRLRVEGASRQRALPPLLSLAFAQSAPEWQYLKAPPSRYAAAAAAAAAMEAAWDYLYASNRIRAELRGVVNHEIVSRQPRREGGGAGTEAGGHADGDGVGSNAAAGTGCGT
ncbi:hypothetical protein DICSQDRAFT_130204 [Dichomitus squalens LYAD-421 SS1]|uniref:DUF6534 domain-containing protein n=1 Tax=Dichomitus squalens (strain LYAD-421) TaxID=732165 RepID=R7SKH3_DICSQ|nr:uncharacterized protein DICSQDRAFT_130204 [Dichomitus squalens LYAD-421 SS1]EJF56210.1 hypothetical protein DICSQDRAFT_130204 [Dichomitus squalens LYAD-421 SS1]